MKAGFGAFLAGLVLLLATLQGAQGAVVIAFSAPGDAYGWCAGYAEAYAESCSQRQCASSGGTDCQLVADCKGGWAAIATSEDGKIVGIGTACNGTSAYGARIEALASCLVASNALCWTDVTLNPAGKLQSKDDNHRSDLRWYAQALLAMRGYKPGVADGDFGRASTAALEAFETDIGRAPDGLLGDEIVDRLFDAAGGISSFVPAIKHAVVDPRAPEVSSYTYGSATAPSKIASQADELAAATADRQRLAAATILSVQKTKCSLPAKSAVELPGSAGGAWNVTCTEGQYTLMLGTDGSTIIATGAAAVAPASNSDAASDAASARSMQQPVALASPALPASAQSPPDEMAPVVGAPDASAPPQMPPPPADTPATSASTQNLPSFVTGAGLQGTCPATAANDIACVAYLQGVVDAFIASAAADGKPLAFCLPAGETGPQLSQLINDYLTTHTDLQQAAGADIVLQALSEKLPCNAQ